MKKFFPLLIVAAVLACACSSDKPEECYISKNTVEFAGNAFSSFSLGGDVKLYTAQNPENSSQWTIQAVVPVRKEVSNPINDLSINLVMLDNQKARVRDGFVLQAEDLENLLPVYNASENVERTIVFSIPEEEKKYLTSSEVSELLEKTKGIRMDFNVSSVAENTPEAAPEAAPENTPETAPQTPTKAVEEKPATTEKAVAKSEPPAPKEYPMTVDGLCRKYGVYGLLSQYEQAYKDRNKSRARRIEDQLWAIEKRVKASNSIPERLRDSFVRYIENKEDDIEDRY